MFWRTPPGVLMAMDAVSGNHLPEGPATTSPVAPGGEGVEAGFVAGHAEPKKMAVDPLELGTEKCR